MSIMFRLQADSSVYAGHVELEQFLVAYFDAKSKDDEVLLRHFFCVHYLMSGTGRGLFARHTIYECYRLQK